MKTVFIWLLAFGFWLLVIDNSHAQSASSPVGGLGGIAVNVQIIDKDIVEGDIISVTKEGFKRSSAEYDISMYGVVANSPILSVEPKTDSTRAVISSGETKVRVSNKNGNIEVGDLITSSATAGVGQKAAKSGYVIGKALEGYSDSAPGLIAVLVGPSFGTSGSSVGTASGALFGIVADPANLRYVLAAIVGIIAAILATAAFIRLISTGVGAIGRNPLARGSILRSMVLAGIVIAILAIAGAAAVVAIITLG